MQLYRSNHWWHKNKSFNNFCSWFVMSQLLHWCFWSLKICVQNEWMKSSKKIIELETFSIFVTYVGDVYSDVLYRGTNCLLTVLQWNLSVPSCQLVIRCRSRWWRPIVTLSHPINCVPYRSWTYLTQLKPFCHAMLCIGAAYAVVRCSSVWMSATFVYSDKTSKYIFKIFHRWVASSHNSAFAAFLRSCAI